ncbi:hypothetical protein FA15DRAFT_660538 [Coprinopsis marcescibilis]|uniref:Uncharacterized protein n=1 Tax=Coprinopsis marcescibilis TaxID=230819 RepID=A0A5C3KFM9_COPMA|nr:hypothetical protein FA15DRAFT_660538 [Coprinopsis marcescibilis]
MFLAEFALFLSFGAFIVAAMSWHLQGAHDLVKESSYVSNRSGGWWASSPTQHRHQVCLRSRFSALKVTEAGITLIIPSGPSELQNGAWGPIELTVTLLGLVLLAL